MPAPDLLILAALAHVDPRTARRWRNGERVMPACDAQLRAADAALKSGAMASAVATTNPNPPHRAA